MKTIDEQLEDALARVKQLEADAQAGTNLLNEAAKTSHVLPFPDVSTRQLFVPPSKARDIRTR